MREYSRPRNMTSEYKAVWTLLFILHSILSYSIDSVVYSAVSGLVSGVVTGVVLGVWDVVVPSY